MISSFRRSAWISRVMHVYWRFARPMTLGVRGMVIDADGRIFLIKHSYVEGWHLPGGGVEAGETMLESLGRELAEEGNIEITAPPALFGFYFHPVHSKRDHVALYVIREFRQTAPPVPGREIVAHGFFPADALPEGTTRGTRARIAEVLHGVRPPDLW